MGKNKELVKNTIIFGIGTIGAKMMQFILIPLYTLYLTTSDYSISDIISSTVIMITPFMTLGMGHGIFRFVISKKENRAPLLRFSVIICLLSTCILFLAIPLLRLTKLFAGYDYMIPVLFLTGSLRTVLSNYCKAIDKNKEFAIEGIVSAFMTAALSIVFLRFLHAGVKGYLWAFAIAHSISIIYYFIICRAFSVLKGKTYAAPVIKEALRYSIPLMPNDLSWWIIQMSDRYMITWICGSALNGVYTMAYKIPGIFNIIVSVFISAFNITAFKECDGNQESRKYDGSYFQWVYEKYLAISFCSAIAVLLLIQPVAFLFIKKGFYESWQYTPFLMVAFLIGNLEAFLGSILGGIKKTNISFVSTIAGAIANITLNVLLIPRLKAYGAIIATNIAYFLVYLIRYIGVKKYVNMDMHHIKSVISILLVVFSACCYVNPSTIIRFGSIVIMIFMLFIYRIELTTMSKQFIHGLNSKIQKRRNS